MNNINFMEVTFKAVSENESFARLCVAGFCVQLNPSIDEIGDIKTAVSEAVTNCVVHAYPKHNGTITMRCELYGDTIKIIVKDQGIGIKDIAKAREPFYTTKPSDERSGMGFAVMESFMDRVDVEHNGDKGLIVTMYKQINQSAVQVSDASWQWWSFKTC